MSENPFGFYIGAIAVSPNSKTFVSGTTFGLVGGQIDYQKPISAVAVSRAGAHIADSLGLDAKGLHPLAPEFDYQPTIFVRTTESSSQ